MSKVIQEVLECLVDLHNEDLFDFHNLNQFKVDHNLVVCYKCGEPAKNRYALMMVIHWKSIRDGFVKNTPRLTMGIQIVNMITTGLVMNTADKRMALIGPSICIL